MPSIASKLPRPAWRQWLARGANLLYPPACAACEAELDECAAIELCEACSERFLDRHAACNRCGLNSGARDARQTCPQCGGQRLHFDQVARLGGYEDALRQAVLKIKSPHERRLALALGKLLALSVAEPLAEMRVEGVVPVPMHWSRRVRRGTNSALSLGEVLAERLRVPLAGHLVTRRRRTAPQAELTPPRRVANMRGAFAMHPHPDLAGARLLVVDDIMTTGATVNEIAKVLKRGGASFVGVAVLARAEGLV